MKNVLFDLRSYVVNNIPPLLAIATDRCMFYVPLLLSSSAHYNIIIHLDLTKTQTHCCGIIVPITVDFASLSHTSRTFFELMIELIISELERTGVPFVRTPLNLNSNFF